MSQPEARNFPIFNIQHVNISIHFEGDIDEYTYTP